MDVETQPPLENGTKEDKSEVSNSPNAESESLKPNLRSKSKRSRSRTPGAAEEPKSPQKKKPEAELNGKGLKDIEEEQTEEKKADVSNESTDDHPKRRSKRNKEGTPKVEENKEELSQKESPKKLSNDGENSIKQNDTSPKHEQSPKKEESVEMMEPLVLSDEHDPELQFDESSDLESGKGSPVLANRCTTRRSQTRNIPTPKTPKSLDQDVESSEKNSVTTDQLETENDLIREHSEEETNDSNDNTNVSTRAEAGSDITRIMYIEKTCSLADDESAHDDSYLNEVRERSLSDTLRSLSARKPIREDYRRRALRMAQERSDLNLPYSNDDSVDNISSGVKRKNRSLTPEDRKKFKADSPSSLFSSPFATLRNKFRSDVPTSTPKLMGYKDSHNDLHFEENHGLENGVADKKNWCTVM